MLENDAENQPVLKHVALISFWLSASKQEQQEILELYQTLAEECGGREAGIFSLEVRKNLDLRKNMHLVEIAIFRDQDALQAFRAHHAHHRLTDRLSKCATWYTGDFYGSP